MALVEPAPLEELFQRFFFAHPRFTLLVLGVFAVTGIVFVTFGI